MEETLPKFNVQITEDRLHEGARELISKIRPEWPLNKLSFKIFTDGITNRLIGVYFDPRNKHDMVLIRIYGENTDLFIDRNTECCNMKIMYKHGLSAPIYGTFLNGICYGYSPGKVLDENLVRDSNISQLIAEKMAQMHTLKPLKTTTKNTIQQSPIQASLFRDMKKFVALVDSALPLKPPANLKFKNYYDIENLKAEINYLEQILIPLCSPIVFCHNDLLLKNIIFNESTNNVTFIDFEYSDYNYQAFDIANHFCEFCGVDSFDCSLYPNQEFQFRWLKIYLKKWYSLTNGEMDDNRLNDSILERNIEPLYNTVSKFALASCLYWGLWALVQVSNSSIDFDYESFAFQRLNEYYRRKNLSEL